jgi:glycosyltransferase involved in cell wall biosynthesis
MPQQTEAMKARLTIAIPTFNRAEKLREQLDRLMLQLTPEVRCCVYDNASPDGTREVVAKYNSRVIAYTCASYNGGVGRNTLRCFEECQTEWLWILSDDDPISASAVADLLRLIKHCQADFIHTSAPDCPHDADTTIDDISQLLNHASTGSLLWISTGVYRNPSFRPLLRFYADGISTWGPWMVMVLALLEKQAGKALVSSTRLITQFPGPTRWSTLDFIVRFSHLPEYLRGPRDQALLAQGIANDFYYLTLLMGLRELDTPAKIHRWQLIRKLAWLNLKAFGAKSPAWDMILEHKWHRAGNRRKSLLAIYYALMLTVLSWCPDGLFLFVLKWLPKPGGVRDLLHETNVKALEPDW